MSNREELAPLAGELRAWRRDLHAHPETAFQEQRTSDFVADKLAAFGLRVRRGLGRTGVVGTLEGGSGGRAIALRADMDALDLVEENSFAHRSLTPGKMHGCGHDGHTVMLLGAAKHLAATRRFCGSVHFVFQPAEENEGGGREMVQQGLFTEFPCEAVFGLHNWPGMPVGTFGLRAGPMMASYDVFEITLAGRGTHAAMPHVGVDPVLAGAALVQALQGVVSRSVNPIASAVVSVTQFHAGDTWNVIPSTAVLRGTTRAFEPAVQELIERRIRELAAGIASAHGAEATVRYERRYPPTVNAPRETELCARVLTGLVGADNVVAVPPTMGAEDFAFMLQEKPGCYAFIGNGSTDGGRVLHSPRYDFNDDVLTLGAAYWVRLVEESLAA